MESENTAYDSRDRILRQVKNLKIIIDMLKSLCDIWDKIGADEEQQRDRLNRVCGYIINPLKDILSEEKSYYEDIKECIKNYEEKIAELSAEVSVPKIEDVVGTPIVVKEKLHQELSKLVELKHKRYKAFRDLQSLEEKYCKMLDIPPADHSVTTGVLSEKNLGELEQHINVLKEEKEHRCKKFYSLKNELTTILETTELIPETSLEKEILSNNEENLSLSNETFELLEQIVSKTKNKKADMEKEKKVLLDKLITLWDRLKIDKAEREVFVSQYKDSCVSHLNAIKQEITCCEEKCQTLKKSVDILKGDLLVLWEECFISESQRQFLQYNIDDVNAEVLEAYDNEVVKWHQYYRAAEHIISKIKKRNKLWDLLLVFENKATDCNRFINRGGNLLQEENERKKLQKDLPALETNIFHDIEKYEEEYGKPFLYFGMDFRDYVTKQWEERLAQKENEKLTRQKLCTKQMQNEMALRTITNKRQIFRTPKSAPSKLHKFTAGKSVYDTPKSSSSKPIPCTIAKMKSNTRPMLKSNMPKKLGDTLKECNNGRSSGKSVYHTPKSSSKPIPCTSAKMKSNTRPVLKSNMPKKLGNTLKECNNGRSSGSKPFDGTTYTDFATKLNKSSRYLLRSTILSSRKRVSIKMSVKSKRNSKSKSMGKKTGASKKTVVRGKLGLPFIA